MSSVQLYRSKTTLQRRTKIVQLSPTGNFVVKSKVPEGILSDPEHPILFSHGEEFETMRYSAVTCDPDVFSQSGYDLRSLKYNRSTEIAVVVTMYNENAVAFSRTLYALALNLRYLCQKKSKYGWDEDGWKRVVICIVSDGRSKIHPDVLKVLEVIGVYQDGIAQAAVNGDETQAHLYEYTAQFSVDESLRVSTVRDGLVPMQIVFCLKEKNMKKINSHRWFFNAFCPQLNPRVCVLIDVGTRPEEKSLYKLWKCMYRNEQIAGACGEIRADLGQGFVYIKNILNPIVASQNFEYKISNLVDKSLESDFGYISVLPGAFSAYRYEALKDVRLGTGPLAKYFEGEARGGKMRDESIFFANLYLAEDRILCFELIAKENSRWILKYVSDAYAETDVPDNVPEFLLQRRRWLNGSLFAGFYALANVSRVWQTQHSIFRKLAFSAQSIYNILNQVFSWFILGNFAVTFFFLLQELETILRDPSSTAPDRTSIPYKIIAGLLGAARLSYPVVLIALFIISFGNRPQAFRLTYKYVMVGFGLIGAGMISLLIRRLVLLARTQLKLRSSDLDHELLFEQIMSNMNPESTDASVVMINTLLAQVSRATAIQVQMNAESNRQEGIMFVIALSSTVGIYFAASLIQLDFAHMFTCFIQYLLLLPSYINVLTVYSLSNLHDVSWGTKGETKAEILPALNVLPQNDGSVVANASVVSNRSEINLHYDETRKELASLIQTTSPQDVKSNERRSQEDDYKAFRTSLMLSYVASNGILFVVATQVASWQYVRILLGGIALLSGIKFIGVFVFVTGKMFMKCGKGRGKHSVRQSAVTGKSFIRNVHKDVELQSNAEEGNASRNY